MPILDEFGKPFVRDKMVALREELSRSRRQMHEMRQSFKASYDAAQTNVHNELHWGQADNLGPNAVNSSGTRRILRSRSRYELIENNPFLKGIVLSLVNDFVGTGPKLQIIDKRLSTPQKEVIEKKWQQWAKLVKFRIKLWRLLLGKIVDGESFMRLRWRRRLSRQFGVGLYPQIYEAEQISSDNMSFEKNQSDQYREIDGIRLDSFDEPVSYHLLAIHPGDTYWMNMFKQEYGQWIKAKHMIHWFRQDRGWNRGIPEMSSSIPLCAILRRYTLAMVRHAEMQANLTGVIESQGPASAQAWTDGAGNLVSDNPFDIFPIEQGMLINLPWGYSMKQLEAVPLGVQYDEFIGAVLREIVRPILVPYNVAVGSSKDSNMAASVVDIELYKGGQQERRLHCNDMVLTPTFEVFWEEGIRVPGFFNQDVTYTLEEFRYFPPEHIWRWDRVGLDHTDPSKVAKALETLHDKKFITDRWVQETYYNRDLIEWQEEVVSDAEFRAGLPDVPVLTKKERELPDEN